MMLVPCTIACVQNILDLLSTCSFKSPSLYSPNKKRGTRCLPLTAFGRSPHGVGVVAVEVHRSGGASLQNPMEAQVVWLLKVLLDLGKHNKKPLNKTNWVCQF